MRRLRLLQKIKYSIRSVWIAKSRPEPSDLAIRREHLGQLFSWIYLMQLPAMLILSVALLLCSYSASVYSQEIKIAEKKKTYDYIEKRKKKKRAQRTKARRSNVRRIPRSYKDQGTAALISAVVPGGGQVYAGRPGKGVLFLTSELALFTAAGFYLDRAGYYNSQSDRVRRFYDEYSESWLTYDEGYDKARENTTLGTVFLLSGLGVHLWNILDAANTAQSYNQRRSVGLDIKPHSQGIGFAIHKRF